MKGTVLTEQGDPVQVVSVTDDDGGQIAIVGFPPAGESDGALIGAKPLTHMYPHVKEAVREAARAALAERDAHMLHVITARMRTALSGITAAGLPSTAELSPGGRKMSFKFQHRPVDAAAAWYEVTVRRLRA